MRQGAKRQAPFSIVTLPPTYTSLPKTHTPCFASFFKIDLFDNFFTNFIADINSICRHKKNVAKGTTTLFVKLKNLDETPRFFSDVFWSSNAVIPLEFVQFIVKLSKKSIGGYFIDILKFRPQS
jgi:hypothetical protein